MYLIGIRYDPWTNHKYFTINEIFFNRIIATHQNPDIKLKTISQDVYSQTNKWNNIKKWNKSKKTNNLNETCHILQKKTQKTGINYSNKTLDNFWLIVLLLSLTLSAHEKEVIKTSFGTSSQNQIVETTSR